MSARSAVTPRVEDALRKAMMGAGGATTGSRLPPSPSKRKPNRYERKVREGIAAKKTRKQIADELDITPGRVSQIAADLRLQFASQTNTHGAADASPLCRPSSPPRDSRSVLSPGPATNKEVKR